MNHLSRFRVRCLALSVTGIAALIVTASAFAWQYTYVDAGTYAAPGQYFGSPSNANLDYNEIGWFVAGSADLTLCNTAGACYAPYGDSSGYVQDLRTISYGSAWCGGDAGNSNTITIRYCHVSNEL
jgi:hypothetical protein